MTLTELLKSLSLSDEQIEQIISGMRENKIYTASEENLDIRYAKLKEEHEKSEKLIAELKESTKDQEGNQDLIKQYQEQIKDLEDKRRADQTDHALERSLIEAGVKPKDVDYIMFKCKNDADWKPVLDDAGNIKGMEDKIKGLKTQYPDQFSESTEKKIDEHVLPEPDDSNNTISQEDFNKMGYAQRLKVFNDNPELYEELTKEGK